MASHLIYHPKRCRDTFGTTVVYFDRPRGNQDPYVWNDPFLHTYCHITELTAPAPGDFQFWVSGDQFPDFTKLFCDLVFVVDKVYPWSNRDSISLSDPIVDSQNAFDDHYKWAHQHKFKKRNRFTLKACSSNSFQPQDSSGALIDILPFLGQQGFHSATVQTAMKKGFASKPMQLTPLVAAALHTFLSQNAAIRLTGSVLQAIRNTSPRMRCK